MPQPSKPEGKHIIDFKSSLNITRSFLELIKQLESMPNMAKVSYDRARSLYHAVSKGRDVNELSKELEPFFGPAAKPAEKSLPLKMRMNPTVKYLYGIRDDQVFFIKRIRNGFYYGALWPWQRIKGNVTVHLGYCGSKMNDADYQELEKLVKSKTINEKLFQELEADNGSQLYGINLPTFLQLALIEKISCSLAVSSMGVTGQLDISNGELVAAEVGKLQNRAAAYEMLSWENAEVDILDTAVDQTNQIDQSLTEIFSEALRIRKDQKGGKGTPSAAAKKAPRRRKDTPRDRYKELIEVSKPSTIRRLLPAIAIGFGISIVLIIAGVAYQYHLASEAMEEEYQMVLTEVEEAYDEDDKIAILEDYISYQKEDTYVDLAQKRIHRIEKEFEEKTYREVMKEVKRLSVDDDYELAASQIYNRYLERYPEGTHADEIREKLFDISDVVDDAEFKRIVNATYPDYQSRIEAHLGYLREYPFGRNKSEIEAKLSEIVEEYYIHISKQIRQCQRQKEYDRCIKLCDSFMNYFGRHPRSDEIKQYKSELAEQKDYATLLSEIKSAGRDYQKNKQLYLDFLGKNPNTIYYEDIEAKVKRIEARLREIKDWEEVAEFSRNPEYRIDDRIEIVDRYIQQHPSSTQLSKAKSILRNLTQEQRLREQRYLDAQKRKRDTQMKKEKARIDREQRIAQKMVQQIGRRYVANGDGTVTDKSTGLMWCILDSYIMSSRCLDYSEAEDYVEGLSTAGHSDWRFPSGSELAKIYKTTPFFQPRGAQWYWTSEVVARGYHEEVLVVTSEQEKVFKRLFKGINQCGAVRAVRQP